MKITVIVRSAFRFSLRWDIQLTNHSETQRKKAEQETVITGESTASMSKGTSANKPGNVQRMTNGTVCGGRHRERDGQKDGLEPRGMAFARHGLAYRGRHWAYARGSIRDRQDTVDQRKESGNRQSMKYFIHITWSSLWHNCTTMKVGQKILNQT